MDLHNWSAASISRAPSTRGIWASQNRVRETLRRIKRLELVLWQKTESWGSPWRRAGRLQGNLTIACQYIKEVHKTERKRLFTTISSNTNRSKRFELKEDSFILDARKRNLACENVAMHWIVVAQESCACPVPGSVQDWDGCSFEQPELAKDVYTHGSGIGLFHL